MKNRKVNLRLKHKIYRLNPDKSKEEAIGSFVRERWKASLSVLTAVLCLSLLMFIKQTSGNKDARFIARGEYGDPSRIITRSFVMEELNEELDVEVFAREYSEEEADGIIQHIKKRMPQLILSDNQSLYEIRHRLNLIRGFDDMPIRIYWQSDHDDIVRSDGEVFNTEIGDEGRRVMLEYHMELGNYTTKDSIELVVLPPIYTEKEATLQALYHRVRQMEEESREEKEYVLPDEINGKKVIWNSSRKETVLPLVILGIILSFFVYFLQEKKLDEKLKYRRQQLARDYYEIANKFILYMEAGISPKSTFEKLSKEYLERRKDKTEGLRYAYEEILIMNREMQSGADELQAYENCGKRCELIQYKKLFGYVIQSIRKGPKYISEKLKSELQEAFEFRKANAIRTGEEAGTKLMLPMLMMLGIVIAILIIPAFSAFGLS